MTKKPDTNVANGPSVVKVKHSNYEPTAKELREDLRINATPEELAMAILRPVKIVRE